MISHGRSISIPGPGGRLSQCTCILYAACARKGVLDRVRAAG
jgi:hypothetical protein